MLVARIVFGHPLTIINRIVFTYISNHHHSINPISVLLPHGICFLHDYLTLAFTPIDDFSLIQNYEWKSLLLQQLISVEMVKLSMYG